MGERAPLLAKAVGGKVLGPRPGLAIVSFWQGILEIVLRALALVSHTSGCAHTQFYVDSMSLSSWKIAPMMSEAFNLFNPISV